MLALVTVIGSMGNGPLAAVLWENGVLFAGIVAFLYADFVVIPSLRINAAYYGWRFAAYPGMVFTASAVLAGITMHPLFWAVGLIPEAQAGGVEQMARFRVDYVLYLNFAAACVSAALLWQARGRAA